MRPQAPPPKPVAKSRVFGTPPAIVVDVVDEVDVLVELVELVDELVVLLVLVELLEVLVDVVELVELLDVLVDVVELVELLDVLVDVVELVELRLRLLEIPQGSPGQGRRPESARDQKGEDDGSPADRPGQPPGLSPVADDRGDRVDESLRGFRAQLRQTCDPR